MKWELIEIKSETAYDIMEMKALHKMGTEDEENEGSGKLINSKLGDDHKKEFVKVSGKIEESQNVEKESDFMFLPIEKKGPINF